MKNAYILAAYRTPGTRAYKGKFKSTRPDDLAAAAIKGLIERTGVDGALVEDVILGCAFPEGEAGWDIARVAAMRAGLPVEVPGMTINRLCSSGNLLNWRSFFNALNIIVVPILHYAIYRSSSSFQKY